MKEKYLSSYKRPIQAEKREIAFSYFEKNELTRAQMAERLGVMPATIDTWKKRWREREDYGLRT